MTSRQIKFEHSTRKKLFSARSQKSCCIKSTEVQRSILLNVLIWLSWIGKIISVFTLKIIPFICTSVLHLMKMWITVLCQSYHICIDIASCLRFIHTISFHFYICLNVNHILYISLLLYIFGVQGDRACFSRKLIFSPFKAFSYSTVCVTIVEV